MNTKVLNEVFNDLEVGKFDIAEKKLSDNFCAEILGRKLNKTEYLHAYRSLLMGIPDLKLNLKDIKSEGNKVKAKLAVSGTNSRPIPAVLNGWKDISATNKTLDGFVSDLEIIMKDDRIVEIRNIDNHKGMFVGLIGKLGLDYTKYQSN